MRHPALLVVVAIGAAFGTGARGGFEPTKLIVKSDRLEASSTHVVVGELRAFHELEGGLPAGPMRRYVAEVAVEEVEKGAGLRPGELLYVRFHSPRTPEQLVTERAIPGCGGDAKVDPIPGERLRAYLRLDDAFDYVADHPDCFFAAGRASPRSAPRLAFNDPALRPWLISGLALPFGILIGRRSRPRRAVSRGLAGPAEAVGAGGVEPLVTRL